MANKTEIIAEPGTLTGSIGVVGGKPNLKKLYDKVGVNKTSISKGDFAKSMLGFRTSLCRLGASWPWAICSSTFVRPAMPAALSQ